MILYKFFAFVYASFTLLINLSILLFISSSFLLVSLSNFLAPLDISPYSSFCNVFWIDFLSSNSFCNKELKYNTVPYSSVLPYISFYVIGLSNNLKELNL